MAGEAVLVLGRGGPDGNQAGLLGDALVLLSVLFGAAGNVAGGRLQQAGYLARHDRAEPASTRGGKVEF